MPPRIDPTSLILTYKKPFAPSPAYNYPRIPTPPPAPPSPPCRPRSPTPPPDFDYELPADYEPPADFDYHASTPPPRALPRSPPRSPPPRLAPLPRMLYALPLFHEHLPVHGLRNPPTGYPVVLLRRWGEFWELLRDEHRLVPGKEVELGWEDVGLMGVQGLWADDVEGGWEELVGCGGFGWVYLGMGLRDEGGEEGEEERWEDGEWRVREVYLVTSLVEVEGAAVMVLGQCGGAEMGGFGPDV